MCRHYIFAQSAPFQNYKQIYETRYKLLLTVYVDDLLLSGPEGAHEAFWKLLGSKVKIGDPELLDRFLGRKHVVTTD